jgi:FlaA1/EpsC-like NDP-sugar epimerase
MFSGRIVYTGLRPGKRLHEELVAPEEQPLPTLIPKVRLVLTNGDCGRALTDRLGDWELALRSGDGLAVLGALRDMFLHLQKAPEPARGSHDPQGVSLRS